MAESGCSVFMSRLIVETEATCHETAAKLRSVQFRLLDTLNIRILCTDVRPVVSV